MEFHPAVQWRPTDADYLNNQRIVDQGLEDRTNWLAANFRSATVSNQDVQDALTRAHKETEINVLDQLLDGSRSSFDVGLSIDREVPGTHAVGYELETELLSRPWCLADHPR